MQLFILDQEPAVAAAMLCDVHVRKMCLETAQILSAVMVRRRRILQPGMPRVYNINHPVIAALDVPFKVNWALLHNEALHGEYFYRFGRKHTYCRLVERYMSELFVPHSEPDWNFARNFSGVDIVHKDIVAAYREYYRLKKRSISRWHYTKRPEPEYLDNKYSKYS